jgi:Ca2+-binding EF-hand superfamily protein
MRIRYLSIAWIGTLLVLASCAEPETPSADGNVNESPAPGIVEPSFNELDTNGDGSLSAAETGRVPALQNIFALADRDQDGMLNVAEFSQATIEGTRVSPDSARGPLYLALDGDENGRISPEEARAVPQLAQNFERYDVNGSGGIDEQEYQDALDEGLTPDAQN